MSETTATAAPAGGVKVPADRNIGQLIGRVVEKNEWRQGSKGRTKVKGDPMPKEDSWYLTLDCEDQRVTLQVSSQVFGTFGGGDLLLVEYSLGSYVENDIYVSHYANPTKFQLLKKGDGKLHPRKSRQQAQIIT